MVDFQKAQCFFVLALEIATLNIVTKPEKMAATFGSFLLPFLSIQYDLMSAVSMGGMVPVTFTLLTIHIADRRSWFLLFLTSLTVVVSTTTYILLLQRGSDTKAGSQIYVPLTCGTGDPTQYCASDFSELKKPTFWKSPGATSMVISVITLVVLVIDHFAHIFQPSWFKLRRKTDDPWALSFGPLTPHDRRVNQTILASCYFIWTAVCAAYIWAFTQIFRTLSISNPSSTSAPPGGNQGPAWSFGQIVAITVWAPSVIELFYLLHRKCAL